MHGIKIILKNLNHITFYMLMAFEQPNTHIQCTSKSYGSNFKMSEIHPLLSCTTTTLVVYDTIISLLDYNGLLFITFPITINSPYYSQIILLKLKCGRQTLKVGPMTSASWCSHGSVTLSLSPQVSRTCDLP